MCFRHACRCVFVVTPRAALAFRRGQERVQHPHRLLHHPLCMAAVATDTLTGLPLPHQPHHSHHGAKSGELLVVHHALGAGAPSHNASLPQSRPLHRHRPSRHPACQSSDSMAGAGYQRPSRPCRPFETYARQPDPKQRCGALPHIDIWVFCCRSLCFLAGCLIALPGPLAWCVVRLVPQDHWAKLRSVVHVGLISLVKERREALEKLQDLPDDVAYRDDGDAEYVLFGCCQLPR